MTLVTSADERTELRSTVRAVLGDLATSARVREVAESATGHDAVLWAHLVDLGLVGMLVPEAAGGSGGSPVELALVCEELGAAVAAGAYLTTAGMAVPAFLAAATDAAHAALARIAGGATATAAVHAHEVRAVVDGGEVRLLGRSDFVAEGLHAELLLVPTDHGVALVDGAAPRMTRTPMPTLDLTRAQATVEWDGTPASLVGGPELLDHSLTVGSLMLAAEQVGVARRCLDTAVAYAGTRVQFGRPIGSFQAVKHLCADLLVDIELADSAVEYAVALLAAGERVPEIEAAVSVATTAASDAAVRAATESIHVHGGIGFTWEHDAHLYFRRARADAVLLRTRDQHGEALAEHIGL